MLPSQLGPIPKLGLFSKGAASARVKTGKYRESQVTHPAFNALMIDRSARPCVLRIQLPEPTPSTCRTPFVLLSLLSLLPWICCRIASSPERQGQGPGEGTRSSLEISNPSPAYQSVDEGQGRCQVRISRQEGCQGIASRCHLQLVAQSSSQTDQKVSSRCRRDSSPRRRQEEEESQGPQRITRRQRRRPFRPLSPKIPSSLPRRRRFLPNSPHSHMAESSTTRPRHLERLEGRLHPRRLSHPIPLSLPLSSSCSAHRTKPLSSP
jgi:hypothetical protein